MLDLFTTKPILTVDAIRDNPWNAVTLPLPKRPSRLLVILAFYAADYCRVSEGLIVEAARRLRYVPPGWRPRTCQPDIHEDSENRAHAADIRCEEIDDVCLKLFGVPVEALDDI